MITLSRLPIPPSINQQLAVRGQRLRKTVKAHEHDWQLKRWIQENIEKVNFYRQHFEQKLKENKGLMLRVDCHFVFFKDRLLTKTQKAESPIKTLDANNRLKACLDNVAEIIQVDDKHFATGLCEKLYCENKQNEQVIVVIQETQLRSVEELSDLLLGTQK